jgi:hypothetical protein
MDGGIDYSKLAEYWQRDDLQQAHKEIKQMF